MRAFVNTSTTLITLAGALLLAAPVPVRAQTAAGRLRAGAAKVEITPKPSDLQIATDSIRDHLFVRAIVVDDHVRGSGRNRYRRSSRSRCE
ncbi:MAG: hypothetical protein LAQ69_37540 [Acidobacteriia bacterium]|nr:hypothetical protein [Terriglobia bacterium]